MKPAYYFDMDGVLAIWNRNASEEETHEEGYFLGRDKEERAIELVKNMKKHGFDVNILSSVYQDDHSVKEKDQWLDIAGLKDIPRIFVPYGDDKDAYINIDAETLPVLIDDFNRNLISWEKQGFVAIKFMNGYNNQPKLEIDEHGVVNVRGDSWIGYSIDNRMAPEQMEVVVTSIAKTLCSKPA